jgi:plasmid stability protein
MVKHLTIRNVPDELAEALDRERRRRGKSLNLTVIQLLGQSLGVPPNGPRRNGLAALGGTWTEDEHREFELHIQTTEQVDPELWQ